MDRGLYTRPTSLTTTRHGQRKIYDMLSRREDYDGSMATEFGISRFLVPSLALNGWALFMDCDMLARGNLVRVFDLCDDSKAVMCVKHDYQPQSEVKMDGQQQTKYGKKNWSSFMLFNCDHPDNRALTLDLVNTARGIDLHRFCWLKDEDIGELPEEWNWLVDHSPPSKIPMVVHFTEGGPWMTGYEDVPFAVEWRKERDICAIGAYHPA